MSVGDEVHITPGPNAPLYYTSGNSVVNIDLSGENAQLLTPTGGDDIRLVPGYGGPSDMLLADFPDGGETSPLIRFAVPDFEPVEGVVVSGDILLERLAMPTSLRFRDGDVEFDAEPALEWRFIGSITAETQAELDHSTRLGQVFIDLATIPAGVTNITIHLALELTLEASLDVVAGTTMGVDIRGRQAAVVHVDSGGGSYARSDRSGPRLDLTPPRLVEDTHVSASIGVGSSIGLLLSDSYDLLDLTYSVEGMAQGRVEIDPSASPAVQSGTTWLAATELTGSILGASVTLARAEVTGSDLESIAAPLETPPDGGPAGRGYAQHWATVFDGYGVGGRVPSDLSGDLLVVERAGTGISTYLTAFDRMGEVRWETHLPDFGGNVDALSDGGAVHFAGRIQRVDDQGQLLWSWQRPDYSTLYSTVVAVAERADGTDDIWTAHRYNTSRKERIARHNPDTGEPLFYRELTADGGVVIWNTLADEYGAVLCGYSAQRPLSQGRINDAVVIRMDRDGELLWARKTSGYPWGCAVRQDGSGSMLIFGRNAPEYYEPHESLFAAEYDVDGNLMWHRTYGLSGDIPGQGTADHWSGPHLLDEVNLAAPMAEGWMLAGTTGYLSGEAAFTLSVNRQGDPIAARVIDGVGVTQVRGLHQRGDAFLVALTSPTPGPLVQSEDTVQLLAMMPHDGRIVFDPEVGLTSYAIDVVADDYGGNAGIWGVYTTLDLPFVVAVEDVVEPWTERNDSLLGSYTSTVANATWAPECGEPCVPVDPDPDTDPDTDPDPGTDTSDTGLVDSDSDTVSEDDGPRCAMSPGSVPVWLVFLPLLAVRRRSSGQWVR